MKISELLTLGCVNPHEGTPTTNEAMPRTEESAPEPAQISQTTAPDGSPPRNGVSVNARRLVDEYLVTIPVGSFDRDASERAAEQALQVIDYEYLRDAVDAYSQYVTYGVPPLPPEQFFEFKVWKKFAPFAPVPDDAVEPEAVSRARAL